MPRKPTGPREGGEFGYDPAKSFGRQLNRVQFETHRFRVGWSPFGRLWKVGTTGFELDAV